MRRLFGFRKYDVLSLDKRFRGSPKTKVAEAGRKIVGVKDFFNAFLKRIGLLEYAFLVYLFFVFSIFMVLKVAGPKVEFSNVNVAVMVALRDGVEASMDFIVLWLFFFIVLIFVYRKYSVQYSQGPIKQ